MYLKKYILILLSLLVSFQEVWCTAKIERKPELEVNAECPVVPVLINRTVNPVLKVTIVKPATGGTARLTGIALNMKGCTNLGSISKVSVYRAGKGGCIDTTQLISSTAASSKRVTLALDIKMADDTMSVWVALSLNERAKLSDRISCNCSYVLTEASKYRCQDNFSMGLKTGVEVRRHNQDSVNTYRIPGLTTTRKGTLVAIFDARYDSSTDLQGDIDICAMRSTDGGRTWGPMIKVLDMGEWGGLPQKFNGVSDANILCDTNTGNLFVCGTWMHGVLDPETGKWTEGLTENSKAWNHQWARNGSQPGLDIKQSSQIIISRSTDDGLTWETPVNLTGMIKDPVWWLLAPAPGHGITLDDGTLVMPTQGRDENGLPFSNITWSKDHGVTWTTSTPAYKDVTECMAVQLGNGDIMLNMRDNTNRNLSEGNGRRICVTSNLGRSWTEHSTSHKSLIEPVCMGSIHKHVQTMEKKKKS